MSGPTPHFKPLNPVRPLQLLMPYSKPTLAALAASSGDPSMLSRALQGPDAHLAARETTTFDRTLIIAAILSDASEEQRARCIGILAGHGASPDATGDNLDTPLLLAARLNRIGCLRALIGLGADMDRPTASGKRAVHLTALSASSAGLRALADAGADLRSRDGQGLTLVDLARAAAASPSLTPQGKALADDYLRLACALFERSEIARGSPIPSQEPRSSTRL